MGATFSAAIMRRLMERAAADRGITIDRMLAHDATDKTAYRARMSAALAARERGYSFACIGRALQRDHTTVISAVKQAGRQ